MADSSSPNDFVDPTQPDPIDDMVDPIDSSKLHEHTGALPVIEINETVPVIPPNDTSLKVWKVPMHFTCLANVYYRKISLNRCFICFAFLILS